MNLKTIGAHMTEIKLSDGIVILFSYETPVACYKIQGGKQYVYKTARFFSPTTTRHINKWIVLMDQWLDRTIETVDQEYFTQLVAGVK